MLYYTVRICGTTVHIYTSSRDGILGERDEINYVEL